MPVRRVRVHVGISYATDLGRLVKNYLTIAMHDAFNREGINIPFPQMDVHIRSNPCSKQSTD
jgi:small-conductance mechanosensitive channel